MPETARRGPRPEAAPSNPLDVKIPDPAVSGSLLAISDERDRQLELRLAAEVIGYQRGHAVGYDAGYSEGAARSDAHWLACHGPARTAARRAARRPDLAEIERRRWGPGGREHFGDPRPSDYAGRGDAA